MERPCPRVLTGCGRRRCGFAPATLLTCDQQESSCEAQLHQSNKRRDDGEADDIRDRKKVAEQQV